MEDKPGQGEHDFAQPSGSGRQANWAAIGFLLAGECLHPAGLEDFAAQNGQ